MDQFSNSSRMTSHVMGAVALAALHVIAANASLAHAASSKKLNPHVRTVADVASGAPSTMGRITVRAFGLSWADGGGGVYSGFAPDFGFGRGSRGERGGGFSAASTSKEQESDDKQGECSDTEGNPVVLYTGNKVEPELDFASAGEMGLYLQRVYNHHWSAAGLFGGHWLSNFDYSLVYSDAQDLLWSQRPDGRRIKFLRDTSTGYWYEDKAQPVAYIMRNADGTLVLHNEDGGIENYDSEGYILELRNRQGIKWMFAYADRYLQSVTHSSGRKVSFSWRNGQLDEVTDPAGGIYRYTYNANVFGNGVPRLTSVALPGTPATTIGYHYEDVRFPGGLTGKSFNGTRYSTFAYDTSRRAVLSEHAGGVDRFTFSYLVESSEDVRPPPAPIQPGRAPGSGSEPGSPWCEHGVNGQICYVPRSLPDTPLQAGRSKQTGRAMAIASTATTKPRAVRIKVTATNPLGRKTTTVFEDGKRTSVTGDASPRCPASYKALTYDVNGYADIVSDFADNLTDFDYSAQGFLLKRVEASGTGAARTTTWTWDTTNKRVLLQTVAGDHKVEYTYDERGNIASMTMHNLSSHGQAQQARTANLSYAYHANGLKASVTTDGPLAEDTVTQHFNAQGDLVSVANALGHTITYSNYSALGLPGKITGANGDVIEMTYDARGRLVSRRESTDSGWATSHVTFDATGNISASTGADGVTTRYAYDAARRLLQEVRPLGDGTYAWKQHSYDAASNLTRIEVRNSSYPLGSRVTGNVEGITHDAHWNWFVYGWACTTGSNASIQVDGYAEGGTYLGSTQAGLGSEATIAAACEASGTAYRFQLPITLTHRQSLGGKKVTVYGLSPAGSAFNQPLGGSGAYAIPAAPVIGNVDGVTHDGNWNYFVEGWACSMGVDAPIDVHVYAGGPAGNGAFAVGGRADLATDANVANACQAKGGGYRFRVPLDGDARAIHGGKSIHVHGISPAGGPNPVIDNSGAHQVPPAIRAAEIVNFSVSPNRIFNGGSTTLTMQFLNTGNVVWGGDIYLAWGAGRLDKAAGLPGPTLPGETATMIFSISPRHNGSGIGDYQYLGQLASNGVTWGPRGSTWVTVENNDWYCPPGRPDICDAPKAKDPSIELDTRQGEH